MRKLSKNEHVPSDAFYVSTINGETFIYDESDPEYVSLIISKERFNYHNKIVSEYDKEKSLIVNHDYKDIQSALIAGVGHKGKSISDTKATFKDAVLARQAIQDKRDTLLQAINEATTIEELELISW